MGDLSSLQQTALLDTNMLHYVGLYLKYASPKSLFPFGDRSGKAEAIDDVGKFAEKELRRSLKRGLHVIDVIRERDLQVEYSPVSELELTTGRTKGKAVIALANEGVPDRMWSRFPQEQEIRDRVGPQDMTTIADDVNSLAGLFEDSAVAVKMHVSHRTGYVMDLAKFISGLVFMEPIDSLVYASALVAQADFLFTSDNYLKKTVNLIQHGESDRYLEINSRLRDQVGPMIVRASDAVELATAHVVTADGKIEPELRLLGK